MTHHHLDRPLVPASSVLPSAEKRSGRKSGDRKPFQLPHYKPIHTQSNDSIFSREDSHHLDAFYIPGLIQPQLSQPNSPAPQSFAETSAVDSRSSKPYRTKLLGWVPQKSQGLNQRSRSSSLGNHQPFLIQKSYLLPSRQYLLQLRAKVTIFSLQDRQIFKD